MKLFEFNDWLFQQILVIAIKTSRSTLPDGSPNYWEITLYRNSKPFVLDMLLAERKPRLRRSTGKVVGVCDFGGGCWVIQRPKVKTRSKGARRRARMAR